MDKMKFKPSAIKPVIKKPAPPDMPRHPTTGRFVAARQSFHASNNPSGSRPTQ